MIWGYLIQFVMIFSVIYVVYFIFNIKRKKGYVATKTSQEIYFLVHKYNLDMKKQNYKKMLNITAGFNATIIALALIVTGFFDNYMIKILMAFGLIFPLVLFGYGFMGRYFKKKEYK